MTQGAPAISEAPLGDVVIAPMRRRHLRGVVRIEQQTNHRPWSSSLFAGELALPQSRRYVVALDGAVVCGFGGVMLTGHEAHVTNIAVHPVHHRRGIGTRLMTVLMGACRAAEVDDVTLEVRMSNRGAQEMYRRFGFAPGGVRPRYYADVGEDALIMWAHDLLSDGYVERLSRIASSLDPALRTAGLEEWLPPERA
jgi:ribosomal-protein-alanine N-acetyltransferase